MPLFEPKNKKRRLFEEDISILVSELEEASGLARNTTQSMDKHVTIPHVPSFP